MSCLCADRAVVLPALTGMRAPVAEVFLGEEQESLAVHFEGVAVDGVQGEFLLSPLQPLRHVLPTPV